MYVDEYWVHIENTHHGTNRQVVSQLSAVHACFSLRNWTIFVFMIGKNRPILYCIILYLMLQRNVNTKP